MRGEWQLAMTALVCARDEAGKEPAKVTPNLGET